MTRSCLLCFRSVCAILLATFVLIAISGELCAQSHINNHLGIDGIHFIPFRPFGNLAGTTVSPDPNAADRHAIPTSDYVNNNEVVLRETNIDHPQICQTSPGVCSSDGGSLFESNGHLFFFSADGGANPYSFQEENAFDISFDMTINTTNPLNRKGIGFHIDSDPGGSNNVTQFTAQTTNNLFGGTEPGQIGVSSSPIIPLYSFTDQDAVLYTADDTIRVQIIYLPPERGEGGVLTMRGTFEYRVDTDPNNPGGEHSSGPQEILTQSVNGKAIDGGLLSGTQIGFRAQVVADNVGIDDYTATYANFRILDPTNNADFDNDFDVDGADFLAWQRGVGISGTAMQSDGDANGDTNVDAEDLAIWQRQFGLASNTGTVSALSSVPEPAALTLAVGLLIFHFVAGARSARISTGSTH